MRSGITEWVAPCSASLPWTVSVSLLQALDLRAHRDQAHGEIGDLRLARGILDHRRALGEHRRHQRILGRADRDDREGDRAAGEAARRRDRLHIAGGELDLRAERLQRLQMQVDRPVADRAAAGQRHGRLARSAPAAARARGSRRASCAPCHRARP